MDAQIKVIYKGQLRTEAEHLRSTTRILTDAPPDNNGKGEAFSPTDLVCSALASCMMTIMGIVAKRESIDLTGLLAEVTKVMATDPRKISEIHVKFQKPAGLVLSKKQADMLIRAAITCPVALSLDPKIRQDVKFDF